MAKPPKPAEPRANRARAVGEMVGAVGGVAFRRFGFAQAQLIGRWREVVGPVYARWTLPEGLRFPTGQKSGGTLTIRVDGPFAPQLQHVAPAIIERCNRIFGYAAVARLRLVQGSVAQPEIPPAPVAQTPPVAMPGGLRPIRNEGLRASLEALAAEVATKSGPPVIK
ncbi:DUF721 domain-containing protein [Sandaracinobacteroides saxicola]|nr:DUF721 domain-containing protein [Sandaracinobacteroides saxicola]